MRVLSLFGALLFAPLSLADCQPQLRDTEVDLQQLRADVTYLASDELSGRKSGQEGAQLARQFIAARFQQLGLLTDDFRKADSTNEFFSEFILEGLFSDKIGVNVVAVIPGQLYPDDVIVFTAHYDHLGTHKGKIYPGADDNASGVGALLAMAAKARKSPPQHTHIYVATEYEEQGLYGAKAFVAAPPVPVENIKLNINLDMLSQPGYRYQLYIAGTRQSPWLAELLTPVVVQQRCTQFGHDGRTRSRDGRDFIDWRKASDHWAFIREDIPYLFIGVGEHRFYHQPNDSVEQIDWPFYFNAVQTVEIIVEVIDRYQFEN